MHPAINWAERESNVDADEMAKVISMPTISSLFHYMAIFCFDCVLHAVYTQIKTAFVGNLPADVNEDYLKKLFGRFGEVCRPTWLSLVCIYQFICDVNPKVPCIC